MSKSAPAIGIDLGTTNSCVAVYLNGKVRVLENEIGDRVTPSYVGFTDGETLVGKIAKKQAYRNIKNTIYDVKRLMGKNYNEVQEEIEYWPFCVSNRNGNPEFKIKLPEREVLYCPEQISAIILKNLKDVASRKMGTSVTKAVITVPAYFNDAQRQATKDAGKLAGLEVLMLLNEPTAAAITYALEKNSKVSEQTLVFDLGGGTFDVSIVKFENRRVTVMAIHGDTQLGGNDFDKQLLTYFIEYIKKNFDVNIQEDRVAMARLLSECERTKRMLSFLPSVEIELILLINGKDFCIELTKEKFESLNQDLFEKTLEIVKNCLMTASLTPSDIDNVVLVGGSTRIPKIKSLLQDLFTHIKVSEAVHPDESVAIGAAMQAAYLNNNDSQVIQDFVLEDVVPFSLGIEVIRDGKSGFMDTIIKRYTILPATISKEDYSTRFDDQTGAHFEIYEGEDEFVCKNHFLGSFLLTGMLPAPKGVAKMSVTFDIDVNGILRVTATEKLSQSTNNITITRSGSRLSKERLEMMKNLNC